MPVAERTLPIAATHREFTVLVGGEPVPREDALQALSIVALANRVASAQLCSSDLIAHHGRTRRGLLRLGQQP